MIAVRRSNDRGAVNMGWLNAKHSFSFGNYYDPDHMGFGSLRVINEDRIEPSQGFGTHGHKDMEIVTYIIEGALEHKDSMGNGSVIRRGDVQRMTAGTGVMHSEFNHSAEVQTHLLQIWLLPEESGLAPGYEDKTFAEADKKNQLRLIVSRDARDGSLQINQDADVFASVLETGVSVTHQLRDGRGAWVQVIRGQVALNSETLNAGDGASVSKSCELEMTALEEAEFLLFDMA
jgi:redox-sensitive bicupin YhaK (pirin superfamily)